ncbi:MAG: Holliday junction branch migration protein RuvA [Candidatus Sumerlaeaceae bacterium]
MIEYLRGTLLHKTEGHAAIDVAGVGYGVEVTAAAFAALPRAGEPAELHTYLYVQEAILRLYGFASRDERSLFEVFLGASGIGPKTAIAILSSIEVAAFATAILQGDLKTLTRIPGIGKKTAERLAVELRDKMKEYAFATAASSNGARNDADVSAGTPYIVGSVIREAVEALEALGCKPLVAERAVQKAADILGTEAAVPDLVREALKHRY